MKEKNSVINDNFSLISDNMVRPPSPRKAIDMTPTNTTIEVIGDSLLITELDNNNIMEIELSGE